MKLLLRIAAITFSILLGLVFLYSGYTKIYPVIEPFEFTFVDIGVANWYTAPVLARVVIGLEFLIGLLLILNYRLKKLSLPLAFGVLLFFCLYLGLQILLNGNTGNCGCFGEHLKMTPLQAIIKNLAMLAGVGFVYKFYEGWKTAYHKLLLSVVSVTCLGLPFVVNPIDFTYSSNNLMEKINYPLDLKLLYAPEDTAKVEVPRIDLRKGKHVLAFMSLSCPHCRIAAKKFRLIKKDNPEISIYFVLNGDKEKYAAFIEDTQASNIPSSFCLGKTFVNLASAHLPRIYYLDDGMVVKKVDYLEMNQYQMEQWMFP